MRAVVESSGEACLPAQPNTFRREGDRWRISFEGTELYLRSLLGFDYIAHLIRKAGVDVHVTDLLRVGQGGHSSEPSLSALPAAPPEEYRRKLSHLSHARIHQRPEHAGVGPFIPRPGFQPQRPGSAA